MLGTFCSRNSKTRMTVHRNPTLLPIHVILLTQQTLEKPPGVEELLIIVHFINAAFVLNVLPCHSYRCWNSCGNLKEQKKTSSLACRVKNKPSGVVAQHAESLQGNTASLFGYTLFRVNNQLSLQ